MCFVFRCFVIFFTSTTTIMSAPTYFEQLKKNFVDVPVTEDGVDTEAFLDAAEGLVGIFNRLGSTAFGLVISDLNTNIGKVRTRFNEARSVSGTIEKLVAAEKAAGKKTATEGLLWLLRGMRFTCIALQNSNEVRLTKSGDRVTFKQDFQDSYEFTLKHFHNFVVRGTFSLALAALPTREGLINSLGSPAEKVESQAKEWLAALNAILQRLMAFYVAGKYTDEKGFGEPITL